MTEDAQATLWNDVVGDAWVRHVGSFDATLAPFGDAVIQRLHPDPGDRVLDVGCGAGTTTLGLAATVAPGEVVGVDLSARMLGEARRRVDAGNVANIRLVEADVQTTDLGDGDFDLAFSRCGVMFFPDPVAAFSNIAKAIKPGGRMGFVCFMSAMENPFIMVPVLASAAHLDLPPPPQPGDPSPFSLADPDQTWALLETSGFSDVEIEPGPDEGVLYGASDLERLAEGLLEQNPATGALMANAEQSTRSAAIHAAAEAIGEHCEDDVVRMGAGSWIVTTRRRQLRRDQLVERTHQPLVTR